MLRAAAAASNALKGIELPSGQRRHDSHNYGADTLAEILKAHRLPFQNVDRVRANECAGVPCQTGCMGADAEANGVALPQRRQRSSAVESAWHDVLKGREARCRGGDTAIWICRTVSERIARDKRQNLQALCRPRCAHPQCTRTARRLPQGGGSTSAACRLLCAASRVGTRVSPGQAGKVGLEWQKTANQLLRASSEEALHASPNLAAHSMLSTF